MEDRDEGVADRVAAENTVFPQLPYKATFVAPESSPFKRHREVSDWLNLANFDYKIEEEAEDYNVPIKRAKNGLAPAAKIKNEFNGFGDGEKLFYNDELPAASGQFSDKLVNKSFENIKQEVVLPGNLLFE